MRFITKSNEVGCRPDIGSRASTQARGCHVRRARYLPQRTVAFRAHYPTDASARSARPPLSFGGHLSHPRRANCRPVAPISVAGFRSHEISFLLIQMTVQNCKNGVIFCWPDPVGILDKNRLKSSFCTSQVHPLGNEKSPVGPLSANRINRSVYLGKS